MHRNSPYEFTYHPATVNYGFPVEGTTPILRYYFHVHAEGERYPDDEGCMLDSIQAAVEHAWRIIDYLTSKAEHAWEWRRWLIEVVAEDGSALTIIFPPRRNSPANGKSKDVFSVHGVDATETVVLRRKLRGTEVLAFLAGASRPDPPPVSWLLLTLRG